jgi:hypothetical protein
MGENYPAAVATLANGLNLPYEPMAYQPARLIGGRAGQNSSQAAEKQPHNFS